MATSNSNGSNSGGSGSGGTRSTTGSGNTSDNPGGGNGNPSGTSLTDLTGDLKKFSDSGSPNLNLTPEASKKLVDLIATYKGQLEHHRAYMESIDDMGNEGDLPSAHTTKANLLYDITGPGGAKDMTQKCIDYLDALGDAVGKAAATIKAHG